MIQDIIGTIFPLLIFSYFSFISFSAALKAARQRSSFKQDGKIAEAKIQNYNKQTIKKYRHTETLHTITIICTSPNDGNEHSYVLVTNISKAKRYKKLEKTQVYFIPNEHKPFLREQIKEIRVDSWLGIIGGILCALFSLLFLLALADCFTDGYFALKLHELFFK